MAQDWLYSLQLKISLLLLSAMASKSLDASDWILVTQSNTKQYEARAGSFEYRLTTLREPVASVMFRVIEHAAGKITFVRYYVTVADCSAGFGKLGALDLNDRAIYEAYFAFAGGNIASKIAQTICVGSELEIQKHLKSAPQIQL